MYTQRFVEAITEVALLTRPFLKWPGGKTRLLQHLLPLFSEKAQLCEPFLGSGVVFLNTQFKHYRLNDKNKDLIGLYRVLQKQQENFIDSVAPFFKPKFNEAKQFYALRAKFNASQCVMERSRLFVYLNRHGFNGLCRYNRSGQLNVPFGRYEQPYFPEKELRNFYHKSQDAEFTSEDFETVLKNLRRKSVIYCDPPYVPLSASASFTAYTQFGFSMLQQSKLADRARSLADKGHVVIISNHHNEITEKLYQGAKIQQVSVPRLIGANPSKRKPVIELIAVFGS